MPEGLTLPDQMAYTCMRNIYQAWRDGRLDKEAASAEKRSVCLKYEELTGKLMSWESLAESRIAVMRNTEKARIDMYKNPTVENGLALAKAIDGMD